MISVIIPIFNSEKYLENCLDSVIKQRYQELEIICINDASTDNSIKILQNYQKKDQRIHIINLDKNKGLSYARNIGLDYASGEYILFVDSDDELEQNSINNLYNGIKDQHNIAACIGKIHVIYEANEYLKKTDTEHFKIKLSGIQNVTDNIVDNFFVCVWGILYRRNEIERIKLRFPNGLNYEDNYWHWCFFTSVSKIRFIDHITYKYYRRVNSITAKTFYFNSIKRSIDMLLVVDKICEFWNNNKKLKEHEKFALKLIEKHFFDVIQHCQNYEKSYAAYKCSLILRKYNFDLENNSLLKDIMYGNLAFLYIDTDNTNQYKKFLKLKKFIDKLLPKNSLRKTIILFFCKKIYKIIGRSS